MPERWGSRPPPTAFTDTLRSTFPVRSTNMSTFDIFGAEEADGFVPGRWGSLSLQLLFREVSCFGAEDCTAR